MGNISINIICRIMCLVDHKNYYTKHILNNYCSIF